MLCLDSSRTHCPLMFISANLIRAGVKNCPLIVRYSTSCAFDIAIANTGVVNDHSWSPVMILIGLMGCMNSVPIVGCPFVGLTDHTH